MKTNNFHPGDHEEGVSHDSLENKYNWPHDVHEQKSHIVTDWLMILFAVALAVIYFTCCTGCKKDTTAPASVIKKQTVTPATQDTALLGIWQQDSISTGLYDTLKITLAAYVDITYNNLGVPQPYLSKTWQTKSDSLYTQWNSDSWSYKYIIKSGKLILCSPVNITGGIYIITNYYYHKVK